MRRCTWTSDEGYRCVFHDGHSGEHMTHFSLRPPSSALPDSETPTTVDGVTDETLCARCDEPRSEHVKDGGGGLTCPHHTTFLPRRVRGGKTVVRAATPEDAGSAAASDDASDGPPAAELLSEAERTVASIATMLGWVNTPPRYVLEAEIRALKFRASEARGPAVPRVAPPDQAGRRDVTELEGEMAAQAALGHKRFCVGWHDHGPAGVEEEWIDWPEAFAMLRRASSVVETAGARADPPNTLTIEAAKLDMALKAIIAGGNNDMSYHAALRSVQGVSQRLLAAAVQQEGATDAVTDEEVDGALYWIRSSLSGFSPTRLRSDVEHALKEFLERRTQTAGRQSGSDQ